jgi:hypothetical protein
MVVSSAAQQRSASRPSTDTTPRQINFEMCCQAQLLADAARRPTDPIVEAGPEEIASTKAEMGTPEMGWFSLASTSRTRSTTRREHKL